MPKFTPDAVQTWKMSALSFVKYYSCHKILLGEEVAPVLPALPENHGLSPNELRDRQYVHDQALELFNIKLR
jgi:hypothetical protein